MEGINNLEKTIGISMVIK